MPSHHCICDIEGQRGFFQILLLLNDQQELVQSELYNKPHISISNNITAVRALHLLLKYQLIAEKKKEGSNGKYYQITDKGRNCAQLLTEFETLLIQ